MRKPWTRPELLLALQLYLVTPFGKQHKTHPPIVELAKRIKRSPDAVAMKLCNLTSLDPHERARGISGLSGASKKDRQIWEEFATNPFAIIEELSQSLDHAPVEDQPAPTGPSESIVLQKQRLHQKFFRRLVLANYHHRCALTGNPIPQLLRASHIVPWAVSEIDRVNPRNGICLNALHDCAFDQGLITFDSSYCFMVSPQVYDYESETSITDNFLKWKGQQLRLPDKNLPDQEFLSWHRTECFVA